MKYSVFEIGEKAILFFIGIGAFGAAAFQIAETLQTLSFEIEQLFILFIYAEVIGMVGAYISSSRIPLTLPIIIAITALCRLIVMQSKETEALVLISESASILLLSALPTSCPLKARSAWKSLRNCRLTILHDGKVKSAASKTPGSADSPPKSTLCGGPLMLEQHILRSPGTEPL